MGKYLVFGETLKDMSNVIYFGFVSHKLTNYIDNFKKTLWNKLNESGLRGMKSHLLPACHLVYNCFVLIDNSVSDSLHDHSNL